MFSIILPSRPCLTNYTTISPTQVSFTFPLHPHFSHIVVFILPDATLPPDTAAAVYIQLPNSPSFTLLGALDMSKQSAIFKINVPSTPLPNHLYNPSTTADGGPMVNVGISVEPTASIQAQLSQLPPPPPSTSQPQPQTDMNMALVKASSPSTKVLAQRIIKNAFNFLASFAGNVGGPDGLEVVPLKSFQDWWTKFERRIDVDPGFLERDDQG